MAYFHQFAGVVVEDCIEHYNGEFLLGESCWLQWCLGDLNIGFNACQYHFLLDCAYFHSAIWPPFATCVLGRAAPGLVAPVPGWRFPALAAAVFHWSLAILLNCHGPSGYCGDGLPVVSISILLSTLGELAYSRATLGTAAGSWLLLSTSLGDCRGTGHGTGVCCVGAMILRSFFLSVLGSRISCSFQSLSTMSLCSCRGTPVVRVFTSPPMAATILSSGVTDGLVRFLCLNHTAPDIRMACVSFI
jgi:hypothetical protein